MRTSALIFSALLGITPALVSTAHAADHCAAARCGLSRTGTALEIAQSYANGGEYAGATSGTTGTAADIARDSLSFPGSLDHVASIWRAGRIMAQGD